MNENTEAVNVLHFCRSADEIAFKDWFFDEFEDYCCNRTKDKCPCFDSRREWSRGDGYQGPGNDFIDKLMEELQPPSLSDFDNEINLIYAVQHAMVNLQKRWGRIESLNIPETVKAVKYAAKSMHEDIHKFVYDKKPVKLR